MLVSVCSIHLCRDCKNTYERRKNNPYFKNMSNDILPKLKKQIKSAWLKDKIIEELK